MLVVTREDGSVEWPAVSGSRTECPGCGGELVAAVGEIVVPHWRHVDREDCDPWHAGESMWHVRWKQYLSALGAKTEVFIRRAGEMHRADAVLANGEVVELQATAISVDEARLRERFYGRMRWVFRAEEAFSSGRLDLRPKGIWDSRGQRVTFRWKHPWKTVARVTRPVTLDLGDGRLLDVEWMSTGTPCGGKGWLRNRKMAD